MSTDIQRLRGASAQTPGNALDESLAAWLGWFESAAIPDDMAALVDQLEAAYAETARDRSRALVP